MINEKLISGVDDLESRAWGYCEEIRYELVSDQAHLYKKIFIDSKTGEEKDSAFLPLMVTRCGKLKPTLKCAMELLLESDKLGLIFEFDGMQFSIAREDKFQNVYKIIHSVVISKREAEQELNALRNIRNFGV